MSTGLAPLVRNPFPDSLPDLGVHRADCPGPERMDGYVPFADRPVLAPDARVVLIGGRAGLGKSVLGHRLQHLYQDAGHLTVDLTAEGQGGGIAGPADSLARLREFHPLPDRLRVALRAVRSGEAVEAHRELGRALKGRRVAVRLPSPDPNLRPAAIVAQVLAYSKAAAAANAGVYLFEFPFWLQRDWEDVLARVGRGPEGAVITPIMLAPFSEEELLEFLRARLAEAGGAEAFVDGSLTQLFRALARRHTDLSPINLTWFNTLCHRAFEAAIADGASQVAIHHFLAAAVRSGAP